MSELLFIIIICITARRAVYSGCDVTEVYIPLGLRAKGLFPHSYNMVKMFGGSHKGMAIDFLTQIQTQSPTGS